MAGKIARADRDRHPAVYSRAGLKYEQIRNGPVAVSVLEVLEWRLVEPDDIGFAGLKLDRHDAGFMVVEIFNFAVDLWKRLIRNLDPAPITIAHCLAEGHADFGGGWIDIRDPGLRLGLDDHRRRRLHGRARLGSLRCGRSGEQRGRRD